MSTTTRKSAALAGSAAGACGRSGQLAIEWRRLADLALYENNPRCCPEEAIAAVAASIREFGWKVPLVVDEAGVIVCGHTRYHAAERLGEEYVPVIVAADLSPAQLRAFRLADNKVAELTSWDPFRLQAEIAALVGLEIDPRLTGFTADEIAALLAAPTPGRTDPDEVPEVPAESCTRPGELWLLGEHRLLCGDSTRREDVVRLMNGERAGLLATDPPYLVDYDGGHHPATVGNGGKTGKVYEKSWDAYRDAEQATDFLAAFLEVAIADALGEAPAVYQFFAIARVECVLTAWREAGLLAHQTLIWKKSRAVLTYSDYLWDYEPLLYGWIAGRRPQMRPPADARCVWEVGSTAGNEAAVSGHPTIKPVELIKRPILYHTRPGGLIYEPFCGSGTALIAAEMTGRRCYALEQSPVFCDVAAERWQRFSGREAVRAGTRS